MAIKKAEAFLDTNIAGLVIIVEHNLDNIPDIFLTELVLGQQLYVSLMDARIAEIKVLDSDRIQITFASAFIGFIEMLSVDVDNPSDHDRIIRLEQDSVNKLELIESKTSKDQWIQMNTLLSSQITTLQDQVVDLQSQINLLRADLDAL